MFPMHQYSMHSMMANYHCDYRLILMMIMSTLGFPEGHFYREGSKKAAQKMELFYFGSVSGGRYSIQDFRCGILFS